MANDYRNGSADDGISAALKAFVTQHAPEIVRTNKDSRNYAIIFGIIAILCSILNAGSTVWNSFFQSTMIERQTKLISIQTLAQRASVTQELRKAIKEVRQAVSDLQQSAVVLKIFKTKAFMFYGAGSFSKQLTTVDFIPDYCKITNSEDVCKTAKIFALVESPSLLNADVGHGQMAATLQALAALRDEMSIRLEQGTASGRLSRNLLGILENAKTICQIDGNNADNGGASTPIVVAPGVTKRTEEEPKYDEIIVAAHFIEQLQLSTQSIQKTYEKIRKNKITRSLPNNSTSIEDDVALISGVENLRAALKHAPAFLGLDLSEQAATDLTVAAFDNIIRQTLITIEADMPPVLTKCQTIEDAGQSAINKLGPNTSDWINLTK